MNPHRRVFFDFSDTFLSGLSKRSMPSSPGDYYRRLRLPKDASRREIRTAFRRLARQYHPDLHPNKPSAVRKFQALYEAYEVLIDRVRRQRYDESQQGKGFETSLKNPQTPADFYIRGVRYTYARRYHSSLADYTQAIELDDQFAEAYVRRAEVRYLLGDDSGVLADCQRSIALNSIEAKTYFYQGMARYRLGYVQSAIAAFTDAITCDPEAAQYYYRRGLAYQDLHQINEAAQDLRRASQLFLKQGQMASYQQLQRYLRQFGTAGRSRPIQFLGKLAQRFTDLFGSRSRPLGKSLSTPHPYVSDFSTQGQPMTPGLTAPQSSPLAAGNPADSPSAKDIAKKTAEQQQRGPLSPASRLASERSSGRSASGRSSSRYSDGQAYWAPGVSSRLGAEARSKRLMGWHLFSGIGATLSLLSNPAGEMLPLYRRLSLRQTSLVGYGLAVLANLAFVLGAIQHTTVNSWLVASWLWASGGMMFVAMVFVVAITRIALRIRSLWTADIFMLATAMVPLGILAVVSAIAQDLALRLNQPPSQPLALWVLDILRLFVLLWAVSQSTITLYSGLLRIHTFPEKLAAWFTPVVLALGLGAGVGTWGMLSAGIL
jgi:tetratricopeptide (TPR) repeat protein